jgi:hypothetical protein
MIKYILSSIHARDYTGRDEIYSECAQARRNTESLKKSENHTVQVPVERIE